MSETMQIVNNIVSRYTLADHDFAEWREKLADARAQLFELEEEALIEGRLQDSCNCGYTHFPWEPCRTYPNSSIEFESI